MPRDPVLPRAGAELASFGELVSDPSRVAMLLSLMGGQSRPASELADLAGVSRATASFHLRRLVEGGLVVSEARGRHRYVRLASAQVAEVLESLAALSPATPRAPSPSAARQALARARTCYHHLAGELGVAWLAALERARFLTVGDGAFILSRRGVAWSESVGLSSTTWPAGKPCLDWTERKNHLGGPLGAMLTRALFDRRWIARRGDGRAVRVTVVGQRELARMGIARGVLVA